MVDRYGFSVHGYKREDVDAMKCLIDALKEAFEEYKPEEANKAKKAKNVKNPKIAKNSMPQQSNTLDIMWGRSTASGGEGGGYNNSSPEQQPEASQP